MEKCAMSPYIKNSAGKIVESKLFNDLFSTFKDRGKAWKYYSIATNSKFLNTINQKIETDSNGEITISSFMKIVSLEQSNTEAIQSLEKSLNLQNI